MKILVINGPNLNMLGIREPEIYGNRGYSELESHIASECEKHGATCEIYQSNHEGCIIDKIQSAYGKFDGLVINAGGYTHTSVAIPDAVRAVGIPAVEVHLSDISKREDYRRVSYLRPACVASFMGKGFESYSDAIKFLCDNYRK